MKHPIIDCKIHMEEEIEAHIEQFEDDLIYLRLKLAIAILNGIEKYKIEELADWAVDLEIKEEYLEKINSLESEI